MLYIVVQILRLSHARISLKHRVNCPADDSPFSITGACRTSDDHITCCSCRNNVITSVTTHGRLHAQRWSFPRDQLPQSASMSDSISWQSVTGSSLVYSSFRTCAAMASFEQQLLWWQRSEVSTRLQCKISIKWHGCACWPCRNSEKISSCRIASAASEWNDEDAPLHGTDADYGYLINYHCVVGESVATNMQIVIV